MVAGIRRSPVITPDVVIGKGEEEVSQLMHAAGCVAREGASGKGRTRGC
jgi:hypothetical protein